MRIQEQGGDKCSVCGKRDWSLNLEERNGKLYCDDCLAEMEADNHGQAPEIVPVAAQRNL